MAAHATLSPSSSARWINCPGSLRVIEEAFPDGVPEQTSIYAEEGSRAHAVAEKVAGKRLNVAYDDSKIDFKDAEERDEMYRHAELYADVLENLEAGNDPSITPLTMLEQRVNTGIEGVWGTSDAITQVGSDLYVTDYKYGRGVQVASDENTQMMLYALGALRFIEELFGDALGTVKNITMIIVQPRTETPVSESSISREQLEGWAEIVAKPAAKMALARKGPVVASEEACRWCPAAGACDVRAQSIISEDFGTPAETMSKEQLATHLENIPSIEKWCKDVMAYAMEVLYTQGEEIPGYKTVWKAGYRKISDPLAAIEALTKAGFVWDDIAKVSTQTLTKLDKLAGGKKELAELLGSNLMTTEGKPAIVDADDKRPAITKADTAAEEFSAE